MDSETVIIKEYLMIWVIIKELATGVETWKKARAKILMEHKLFKIVTKQLIMVAYIYQILVSQMEV